MGNDKTLEKILKFFEIYRFARLPDFIWSPTCSWDFSIANDLRIGCIVFHLTQFSDTFNKIQVIEKVSQCSEAADKKF